MPKDRPAPFTRRTVLAGLPAAALAPVALADGRDTRLFELYHAYLAERDEWDRLADLPGNGNFDDPRSIAAAQRREDALRALSGIAPTSLAGIAALAHVLWLEEGPVCVPGTPAFFEEMAEPKNRLIRSIWRGADAMSGKTRLAASDRGEDLP